MIKPSEIEAFIDARLESMHHRPGMWGTPHGIETTCLLLIEFFERFCQSKKVRNSDYLAFRRKHFPKCSSRATTAHWLTDKDYGKGLEDHDASVQLVGMFIAWKAEMKAAS